jgi:hypothetical protein
MKPRFLIFFAANRPDFTAMMQPDFFRSPHHHVAAAKLFFQAIVEALRGRPFLVSGFLNGGLGG